MPKCLKKEIAMTAQPQSDPAAHALHPSILREYDIRGIVGETLHAADAYAVGRAFASHLHEAAARAPSVAVCRDGRLSSPELMQSLAQGLVDAGAQVRDFGIGPTPMLYFAAHHLGTDGAIMLTGSHNPPTHNGFKMMVGGQSFYGAAITALGERIAAGRFAEGSGRIDRHDISADYLAALLSATRTGQRSLDRKSVV